MRWAKLYACAKDNYCTSDASVLNETICGVMLHSYTYYKIQHSLVYKIYVDNLLKCASIGK